MQFKLIALLTLAVASVNDAAVFKRFSGTCDCAGTIYSSAAISQAVQQSRGGTFGRRKYPHRFNNRENSSFSVAGCTPGTLEEFPILQGNFSTEAPITLVLTASYSALPVPPAVATRTPELLETGLTYAHELMNHLRVKCIRIASLTCGRIQVRYVFSTLCMINAAVNQDTRIEATCGFLLPLTTVLCSAYKFI